MHIYNNLMIETLFNLYLCQLLSLFSKGLEMPEEHYNLSFN